MYLKGVPWRFLMRWKEVSADLISAESRCGEGWFEFIHEAIWRCYSPNFNTKWWPRPLSPHRQKFFHEAPCQLIASHPQDHWNFSHLILLVNKDQATVCVHVFLFENCEVSKDSVSARKIKCYVCACVLNIVHIWDNSCSRGLSDFFIFYFFPPFSSPWWHTHTHTYGFSAGDNRSSSTSTFTEPWQNEFYFNSFSGFSFANKQTLKKSLCCLFYQHFNHVAVVCNPGTVPNL